MFELRETGDWDIFLGPLERAREETGGADQWVLKLRECSGFAMVNKVTSDPWDTHYQFSIKTLLSKGLSSLLFNESGPFSQHEWFSANKQAQRYWLSNFSAVSEHSSAMSHPDKLRRLTS